MEPSREPEVPEPEPVPELRADTDEPPFAPLLTRGAAFLVDLVPAVVIGYEMSALVGCLVFVLYHAVSTAMMGSTLGKAAFGLKVEQVDDPAQRWVYAFLRPSAGYLFTCFSGIGLLQIVLHPEHLSLHDVLCKTRVREASVRLTPLAVLKRLQQWSCELDGAISRVISKWGAFGRLLKRLVAAAFYLAVAETFLREQFEKLFPSLEEPSAQAPALSKEEEAGEASEATATLAANPPVAAPTLTLSLAATLPAAALVILAAYLSLQLYDTVVPEPLHVLDRVPAATIGGVTIRGHDVILLKDDSGSMGDLTHVTNAMEDQFRSAGMDLYAKEVDTGGISSTLLQGLRASLEQNPDADTVYFFSDFNDGTNATQLEDLRQLLEENEMKLILGTVNRTPTPETTALATHTGGQLINMRPSVTAGPP